jgi:SAM-dependent methyltransferase
MIRKLIHGFRHIRHFTDNPGGFPSRSEARKIANTAGWIEGGAIVDGVLKLDGWALSLISRRIDGLKVALAGKDLMNLEADQWLPSSDVQADYPGVAGADRCRFKIRVHLPEELQERAWTSLITCTPRVGESEGRMLAHIVEPSIPIPDEELLRYIDRVNFSQALGVDPRGVFCGPSAEFVGYFIQLADLKPASSVLDVGCGLGRMAYMLTGYLDPASSRYEGFDIIGRLIAWAQSSFSPLHPNFHFQKVNIHNQLYNPGGTLGPSEFRFPYEDKSFDLVFLTSVFTHMFAPELRHYVDEIHRVLRPGRTVLMTCFLLNAESETLMRMGRSKLYAIHPVGEGFTADPETPEASMAFKEEQLLDWVSERGFTLQGKYYGYWSGREEYTSYQDILVFQKK